MASLESAPATRDGARTASPPPGVRPAGPPAIVIFMSLALLVWSIAEVASLLTRHTTGPEVYGVLVAALGVAAASLALYAMRTSGPRAVLTLAAAVLWAIVAIGGLAGVAAHVIGPVHTTGPIDPRPRPLIGPLVFTAMGVVGELVLWIWRRQASRAPGTRQGRAVR